MHIFKKPPKFQPHFAKNLMLKIFLKYILINTEFETVHKAFYTLGLLTLQLMSY